MMQRNMRHARARFCGQRKSRYLKTMIDFRLTALLLFVFTLPSAARAHPHVWIDAAAEIVFSGADVTGIRHAWVFDEAFSTYVVQGLDANKDGQYSRDELAQLARENVESLKEFEYFTFGNMSGKELSFAEPQDYWLSFDGKLLTLHFTLPLSAAAPLRQAVFEVYDPSYYVEFKFAEGTPVTLSSAPMGCTASVKKPPPLDEAAQQKLAEADFNAIDSDFAAGFANRAVVACP
jgi:ABC-type uncharacterized transport system substrate-binding protein